MVEVVRDRSSGAAAWLALLLAGVALLLSIVAYNRTGKHIDDAVRDAVNSVNQSAKDTTNATGNAGSRATDKAEQVIDKGPDGQDDGAQ